MSEKHDLHAIAAQFQFRGQASTFAPHGNGHINDTFLVTCHTAGAPVRYILQRINRNVFHSPAAVMQNIERVTAHLGAQLQDHPDRARRALKLVAARDGSNWTEDAQGETWRAYQFIENARSYETATSVAQAFQASHAFGHFQKQLASLPAPRLIETIPDFHHTPKRFAALQQAIAANVKGRAKLAGSEMNLPWRTNLSRPFCLGPVCRSASRTMTPSSITCCSTTPPARAFVSSISTP